jgi:Pyruvate/2-oxoacid:ferredoxin oxidoreductase delta subunit
MVSETARARLAEVLGSAGISFESIGDLCELAANKDPVLAAWANTDQLKIVACFRRAVKWLFARAGASLDDDRVELFNARTGDIDEIISALTADGPASGTPGDISHTGQKGDWIPWFPVIDYDRCVNCKQCLNFCLFGVYALSDDDAVEVAKPDGCKTNCPACARVCPERAIIFPKYQKSPINGDEVDESTLDDEKEKSELQELLGGDIHEVIRKRKTRKLFARAEEGADELSEQQKLSRLARLQSQLDIPQEVLDSLSQEKQGGQQEK